MSLFAFGFQLQSINGENIVQNQKALHSLTHFKEIKEKICDGYFFSKYPTDEIPFNEFLFSNYNDITQKEEKSTENKLLNNMNETISVINPEFPYYNPEDIYRHMTQYEFDYDEIIKNLQQKLQTSKPTIEYERELIKLSVDCNKYQKEADELSEELMNITNLYIKTNEILGRTKDSNTKLTKELKCFQQKNEKFDEIISEIEKYQFQNNKILTENKEIQCQIALTKQRIKNLNSSKCYLINEIKKILQNKINKNIKIEELNLLHKINYKKLKTLQEENENLNNGNFMFHEKLQILQQTIDKLETDINKYKHKNEKIKFDINYNIK